jgi:hypothetical protein
MMRNFQKLEILVFLALGENGRFSIRCAFVEDDSTLMYCTKIRPIHKCPKQNFCLGGLNSQLSSMVWNYQAHQAAYKSDKPALHLRKAPEQCCTNTPKVTIQSNQTLRKEQIHSLI